MNQLEKNLCELKSYDAIAGILNGVELHSLQCVDVIKMLYVRKGIVIYPTGTGKTLLAAAMIKLLLDSDRSKHFVMFVRKDQLIQTPEKLKKYLGCEIFCSDSDKRRVERLKRINFEEYPIVMLTHECLHNNDVLNCLYENKSIISGLIIDEAHKLNNFSGAESGEMLSAISQKFEYCIALTATPIVTNLKQFTKLAYIVDRQRYPSPTKLYYDFNSGRRSIKDDELFFINRTEEELGRSLKPIGLVCWVDGMGYQVNKSVGGNELMQLCKGEGAVAQVKALIGLIKENSGKRGLVYVNQISIRNWVTQALENAGIRFACINGSTSHADRKVIMEDFNSNDKYDVIITSITTAIDLDCDYVVFYEFTVEVDQMIGRAHRGLNDKQLYVYFVITSNTAEVKYFIDNIYQRCMLIQSILNKGNSAVKSVGEEVGALGAKN